MKTAFYLFVISFFITTFLVAPFLRYRENRIIPINTKQEIRTSLESINPLILQKIDARQKEIHVRIGVATQIKLSELSKQPDFDKYLSFKKTKRTIMGDGQVKGIIKELDENSLATVYYLYPKDALIKCGTHAR